MKKYNHILLLPHFFPISNLTLHLLQFIQDQETWEEKRWSVKFGRIEKSFLNHREENIKFQKLIISISSSEKFILNYLKNVGMVVIKIKLGHKELFYFTWEEGCGNWIVKLSCLLKSIRTFFFFFFSQRLEHLRVKADTGFFLVWYHSMLDSNWKNWFISIL